MDWPMSAYIVVCVFYRNLNYNHRVFEILSRFAQACAGINSLQENLFNYYSL